eukprot:Plantae.Rhodophyta-Purpureofilum_apyrenoidigerum.ctg4763.p1 GENE.Plantae.Rhodophyta-Purpureofilum_apyrenoidigerum.ctg4763~~Plantae.Rhodophyta-Purpureofilum_apyrenoidigerum.ctg4763.p1  ORF type:complete len:472 (-),score=79.88 Plantae.Rhodophyta-Purpureofilum_apyrenoidigerum.ctg4763:586-2001(-)
MEVTGFVGVLGWHNGATSRLWHGRECRRTMVVCASSDQVRVRYAASHAVEVDRVGSLGVVAGGSTDKLSAVHVVVGEREGGEQVVGFAAERPKVGAKLPLHEALTVKKPQEVSDANAATLSVLSLIVNGSLETVGVYDRNAVKGKKVVVLGGVDGGTSSFAVQLLSSWGASVTSVTTNNVYQTGAIGAKKIIDPRKVSFSEAVPDFNLVVDALGDERGSSVTACIRGPPFNANYVTCASPLLLKASKEGLIRAGAVVASMARGKLPKDVAAAMIPTERGLEVLHNTLKMASEGDFEHVPNSVVTLSELFESLRWPRDAESGLRFGLPARSLFDAPVSEYQEDEEYDEAVLENAFANDGTGFVVESADEVKAIIQSTARNPVETAVLFVGASWCRKCKELLPTYKSLAQRMNSENPEITFRMLDAGRLKAVAKTLEITDVPEIVVFREGRRIPAWLNTKTPNLMEMSIMKAI